MVGLQPGEVNSLIDYRKKVFEPGTPPAIETIRTNFDPKSIVPPSRQLKALMANTVRDCQLAGIQALVVISGAGDNVRSFIDSTILNPELSDDIYSYLPYMINGLEAAEIRNQRRFLNRKNWPIPEANGVFLVVLDEGANELGRLTLDLTNGQDAAKDVAAFLQKHRPLPKDAKAGYQAALQEAKRTNRKVWVRMSHSQSAPCFAFSRWLDSQSDLLAKDFVLFRFDDFLDVNGIELSNLLKFSGQTVPCHAILNADEKELISSVGQNGNIGNPTGGKDTQHLRRMLTTTAKNLSQSEIDSLVRSKRRTKD